MPPAARDDDSDDDIPARRGRAARDDDSDDDLPARPRRIARTVSLWAALLAAAVAGVVGGGCGLAVGYKFGRASDAIRAAAQRAKAEQRADANPTLPLKTIQAARPNGPFTVRGECTLDDIFTFKFRDAQKTHYSISFRDRLDNTGMHFYVARDSVDGKKLFTLLSPGRPLTMTFVGVFGEDTSEAELKQVVSFE